MVFDRVLDMDLVDFIQATERFKWKFYEITSDEETIRVEVPRGDTENLVLYLDNSKDAILSLEAEGFHLQEIKQWREFR